MSDVMAGEKPEKKKMGRGLKVALVSVLIILIVIAAAGGIYAVVFSSAAKSLKVTDVDLDAVPDGTYQGSFRLYHDRAEVRVVVRDHRIERITVISQPSGSEESSSELVDRVLSEQTLKVDTVTGSTASQKVILRAIGEALSGKE